MQKKLTPSASCISRYNFTASVGLETATQQIRFISMETHTNVTMVLEGKLQISFTKLEVLQVWCTIIEYSQCYSNLFQILLRSLIVEIIINFLKNLNRTKQSLFYNIRKNQKLKKFQMFQKTQRETSAMESRKVAGHFSDQLIYKTPPSDHFRPLVPPPFNSSVLDCAESEFKFNHFHFYVNILR